MKSKLNTDVYNHKYWKLPNGDFHREDGPAIEYNNGDKDWWLNGKRHRDDGPAVERINGYKAWFLNNKMYSEQEYKKQLRLIKLKHIL